MRAAEVAEHVRFLLERLNRSNGTERPFPELVDSLLDALPPLLVGKDPHRFRLTAAALKAIERANEIARAVLDDHLRRALELYLALPVQGGEASEPVEPLHDRATGRRARGGKRLE